MIRCSYFDIIIQFFSQRSESLNTSDILSHRWRTSTQNGRGMGGGTAHDIMFCVSSPTNRHSQNLVS